MTIAAPSPAGDADGSGDITINEILASVNKALSGCGRRKWWLRISEGDAHRGYPLVHGRG